MKLIDKYITKKLISTFAFLTIATVLTIALVDYVNSNEDYIHNNVKYKEIVNYYLLFMFFIANLLTPIIVLVSTVFVTSNLSNNTEIIAILSNGISLKRLTFPYIINGSIIAVLSFLLVGWVLPISSKKRIPFEVKYKYREENVTQKNIHLKIAPNQYIYVKYYNYYNKYGENFTLEEIQGKVLKSKLYAKKILWKPKDNNWELINWNKKIIKENEEEVSNGYKMRLEINLYPKDLSKSLSLKETLTNPELTKYIQELKEKESEEVRFFIVERYVRYMYPITSIILSIFAFILTYHKSRRGSIKKIAIGIIVALAYIGFVIICRGIAETTTTNPLITLFIPNMVLLASLPMINKAKVAK